MKSKIVWITGASSGIGEALTKTYLANGHKVIISARKKEVLDQMRSDSSSPENIFVLPLDLNEAAEMEEKAEAAIQAFGRVDVLINNGGISQRSLAADTSLEVDRKIMEVNFFGTIALSKALLPHFIANKSGHFGVKEVKF